MEPVREGIFTKIGVLITAVGVLIAAVALVANWSSHARITVPSPAPLAAPEPSPVPTPVTHQLNPPRNGGPIEPPSAPVPDHPAPPLVETTPHDGNPEREPTGNAAPETLQERVDNHVLDLKRCTLSGTSLECEILITNQGEDRTLYLSPSNSRLIDEEGTEYSASSLTLGGGGSHVRMMVFGNNKPPAASRLATGISVKAVLSFEGIPSGTKRAALIEIQETRGGFYGGRGLKAQFRNVPLTRP
jgi:hypothetical protein